MNIINENVWVRKTNPIGPKKNICTRLYI